MEKKIKIVYEEDGFMVVDKPAGVVTTRESAKSLVQSAQYLEDWVGEYFPNNLARKGIVHRLDKGTSGLVVVAKTGEMLAKLKDMFKKREVKKTYVALVSGNFPFEAEIQMPIKRSNYGFEKFSVSEEGKSAWTIVKILSKHQKNGKIYSKVAVNLKTGRTHQIRVHLSYLRYPIIGDRLYGGEMLLDRPFLHASVLEINHPITNKKMVWRSEEPSELVDFLRDYEKMD
ncbi:RluA family pseudouridine synthase [Candidatus Shapirobacteria bacterium]|nr:RluA family pseudouridine synthase [Candidatus Shapirobacteria bacterium]